MSEIEKVSIKHGNDNQQENEAKQYFINEENYQLLRQYQQLIYDSTEVSPAIRKLVNELITVENLDKVRSKYLKALQA